MRGLELPTTRLELMKLLGSFNFIAAHLPGLYIIIAPLTEALKVKRTKNFKLTDLQVKAFHQLKDILEKAEDLHVYEAGRHLLQASDASLLGYGSYLAFLDSENNPRVLKFTSRKFPTPIATYRSAVYKECLPYSIH